MNHQTAIVTGGTGSIGREIVTALVHAGANVAFCYLQNDDLAAEIRAELGEEHVLAIKADVRDQNAMNDLVQQTVQRWQKVDVLVTAHSTIANAPIADMTLDQWNTVLDVMLRGTTRICRAVLRPMQKARYGRIVNVAGYQGLAGALDQANYAAAMGGILGFSKALAREVAAWNITVNSVAPGLIARPQMLAFDPQYLPWATNIVPLKRLGTPNEVVPAIMLLASPESAYMTGQTIAVDGGWRMA